jgi:hypothetical protein
MLRSLAAFARVASRPPRDGVSVDARRQLIAQQVADVQGFIESSKFEPGAAAGDAEAVERLTADAQTVFLLLLAVAREAEAGAMRTEDGPAAMATLLDRIADRVQRGETDDELHREMAIALNLIAPAGGAASRAPVGSSPAGDRHS